MRRDYFRQLVFLPCIDRLFVKGFKRCLRARQCLDYSRRNHLRTLFNCCGKPELGSETGDEFARQSTTMAHFSNRFKLSARVAKFPRTPLQSHQLLSVDEIMHMISQCFRQHIGMLFTEIGERCTLISRVTHRLLPRIPYHLLLR